MCNVIFVSFFIYSWIQQIFSEYSNVWHLKYSIIKIERWEIHHLFIYFVYKCVGVWVCVCMQCICMQNSQVNLESLNYIYFLHLICWHSISYWTMKSSIWMNCFYCKLHGYLCLLPPSSRTTGMPNFAQLVKKHWRMNIDLMFLWQVPHWQSYLSTP